MRTHYYGPKDRYSVRTIAIYDSYFEVGVVNNMQRAWNKRRQKKMPGMNPPDKDSAASCAWYRSRIIILFQRGYVTHETIAHEVFHATHRILSYVGIKVTDKHHEAAAYLNGYLNNLVYNDMNRWGIKIK